MISRWLRSGLGGLLVVLGGWTGADAQLLPIISTQTLQNAATATSNGQPLDTKHTVVAILQTSGTFTATVTYEASVDGSTWSTLTCWTIGTNTAVTTATGPAAVRCNVAGWLQVRARVSAYTSGTVTVKGNATSASVPFQVVN